MNVFGSWPDFSMARKWQRFAESSAGWSNICTPAHPEIDHLCALPYSQERFSVEALTTTPGPQS
ncbi:MAG: hypothetical protein ACYSUI_24905, partial [Planctomycetota bacterium]